jgi:hypothetical protein
LVEVIEESKEQRIGELLRCNDDRSWPETAVHGNAAVRLQMEGKPDGRRIGPEPPLLTDIVAKVVLHW